MDGSQDGILATLHLSGLFHNSTTLPGSSIMEPQGAGGGLGGHPTPFAEVVATEMSINVLYLHEFHNIIVKGVNYDSTMMPKMITPMSTLETPTAPPLDEEGQKAEYLWEVDEREPVHNVGHMEILGRSEDGEPEADGPPQYFKSAG